ncbi:MAG TPA: DUF962 domain-containing protein [Pirellulales bacterium]|nr:DUF962 domain-containing protein [Pirellulales bacterium]
MLFAEALMAIPEFDSFGAFWRFYVTQHRQRATRGWHFAGTTAAVLGLVGIAVAGRWLWLPLVPIVGYALAWFSHGVIEGNRPATFGHPLWSLAADFKMWWLIATGRMGREVDMICPSDNSTGEDPRGAPNRGPTRL